MEHKDYASDIWYRNCSHTQTPFSLSFRTLNIMARRNELTVRHRNSLAFASHEHFKFIVRNVRCACTECMHRPAFPCVRRAHLAAQHFGTITPPTNPDRALAQRFRFVMRTLWISGFSGGVPFFASSGECTTKRFIMHVRAQSISSHSHPQHTAQR